LLACFSGIVNLVARPSTQGNFVLKLRALWIGIEIEIVIEIDFWQCSDFDSDFDFDELCPTLGIPREQPPPYCSEIIKIFQRTKLPCARVSSIVTFSA
jgi:hypothetical protein